jgi:hypothetical protein
MLFVLTTKIDFTSNALVFPLVHPSARNFNVIVATIYACTHRKKGRWMECRLRFYGVHLLSSGVTVYQYVVKVGGLPAVTPSVPS